MGEYSTIDVVCTKSPYSKREVTLEKRFTVTISSSCPALIWRDYPGDYICGDWDKKWKEKGLYGLVHGCPYRPGISPGSDPWKK
mgnify:FL=1|jgi:hypothetical protein